MLERREGVGAGEFEVGLVEGGDGGAAEKAEGAFDVGAKDLDGVGDAGLAGGGHAVSISAADEDGALSEAEGFDDIAAATNAAVEEDFGLMADGGDNFRERAECGGDGVELAATVIGNDDGRSAEINGTA